MRLRMSWFWIIPILLLSTFLGTVLLNTDALWFDEWITHFITNTGKIGADPTYFGATPVAEMPVCGDILSHDSHNMLHTICIAAIDNSWPPLFFLLMMLWDFLVGGIYYSDRILALFIGLIGISVTYRLAVELFDKKTGVVAVALLGTTIFYTFYMHEIRGYTLYATLPAVNGLLYWRLLKKSNCWSSHSVGICLEHRSDSLYALHWDCCCFWDWFVSYIG